jgi:fido (protein-threonine AMPylation protein)
MLVLCGLAQLVGFGLLPEGLFRTWPYDTKRHNVKTEREPVPSSGIWAALEDLMELVIQAKDQDEQGRLEAIARIEWEIGIGPIHPFYDGCGRVSRYYSSLLSLWFNVPLAHHASREMYFSAASDGSDAFISYYKKAALKLF